MRDRAPSEEFQWNQSQDQFVSLRESLRRSACILLVCYMAPGSAIARDTTVTTYSPPVETDVHQVPARLDFVRAFSSRDDVRRQHPILDLTLDIIAGSKDDGTPADALRSPSAVTTDSNHHIFVADPGAKAVHIFDFTRAKYGLLDGGSDRLGSPFALAVDGHDNLYVIDQSSKTVLIYDLAGKFRGYLGKLRGGESYFDSPTGIAIDRTTGHIYVCDKRRHMVIIMDDRGRLLSKIGTRGGGNRPGEFRLPSQVVVSGGELFVLDAGNTRIQIFDTAGHFRRTISLVDTDNRTGLAVDSQGYVYITDSILNQIQVFGHDGQRLYTFDPSTIKGAKITRPSGLWVDASDCLYVVDSQSNLVGLFQIGGENARQCP
jgi:DNA-binding beta-propeller fold protein YncE